MKVSTFSAISKKASILSCLLLATACLQSPASFEKHYSISHSKPDFSPTEDISLVSPYMMNVKKGQTLYSIARTNEVPIRDLIELNELEAPYSLHIGQQIKLPKPIYHQVQRGDTLYGIARGYNIRSQNLAAANNLSAPFNIAVGQKLKVPGERVDVAATETAIDANETRPSQPYSRSVASKPVENIAAQKTASASHSDKRLAPVPSPKGRPLHSSFSSRGNSQPHFEWPLNGKVISSFGPKKGGLQNDGINISAPAGSPVKAAEDGVVVYAGNELRGYGNLLLVKHDSGYLSAYAHTHTMLVSKGARVSKGQAIAKVGSTGHVDSPQLHFSIRKGRTALDPAKYLGSTLSKR